jgi:alpha-beta hydrolase superfamily lysophospholipase
VRSPGAFDGLATVQTHATLDARVREDSVRLPLLLFSPGYTGLMSAYTALLEDLASHGYVVLCIGHPGEVVAMRLADGTFASLLDSAGNMNSDVHDVIAEWADEDSTLARATRTRDADERLAILRTYIRAAPKTNAVVARWAQDTRFALERFANLAGNTTAGRVAARTETSRVGAFGHSMGGVVAGQFCVDDARCVAGLNLDGSPQSGTMIDARMPHPFLMVYSARPGRVGASDPIYQRAASAYYRVDVDFTQHLDFSDMNFWAGPLSRAHGPLAPDTAASVTRMIVREYFDQEMRGTPSPLLSRRTTVPYVHVQRGKTSQ